MSAEAHRFVFWVHVSPDAARFVFFSFIYLFYSGNEAVGATCAQPELQKPHRLEETEAVRLVVELADQTITFSPMRGGHRLSTPSRPLIVAINLVNELTVQYRAKKRSRTLANRNKPLPA